GRGAWVGGRPGAAWFRCYRRSCPKIAIALVRLSLSCLTVFAYYCTACRCLPWWDHTVHTVSCNGRPTVLKSMPRWYTYHDRGQHHLSAETGLTYGMSLSAGGVLDFYTWCVRAPQLSKGVFL
ncbi:unnamed protein product, partial [Laminaria digitata]